MSTFSTAVFLGVDLGWYGKPSGLASIAINREFLSLRNVTRLEDTDDILRWINYLDTVEVWAKRAPCGPFVPFATASIRLYH